MHLYFIQAAPSVLRSAANTELQQREEDQVHWTEIISIKGKVSCVTDSKMIVLRKDVRLNEEVLWKRFPVIVAANRCCFIYKFKLNEKKPSLNQAAALTLKLFSYKWHNFLKKSTSKASFYKYIYLSQMC